MTLGKAGAAVPVNYAHHKTRAERTLADYRAAGIETRLVRARFGEDLAVPQPAHEREHALVVLADEAERPRGVAGGGSETVGLAVVRQVAGRNDDGAPSLETSLSSWPGGRKPEVLRRRIVAALARLARRRSILPAG